MENQHREEIVGRILDWYLDHHVLSKNVDSARWLKEMKLSP